MHTFVVRAAAAASVIAASCLNAAAGLITVPATDTGWYSDSGYHSPDNNNFFVGYCHPATCNNPGTGFFRNYFVFDLNGLGVSGVVTGATLRTPAFFAESADSSETLELREVTTSPASLYDGSAGLAAYTDIGDGPVYATNVVALPPADPIDTPLNVTGTAAVAAAFGSTMVMGGQLTSLSGGPVVAEALFGGSQNDGVELLIGVAGCLDAPATGCSTAGKSILKVKKPGTPEKQALGWKWLLGTAAITDFGDLTQPSAGLSLCIYANGALASGSQIASGADWTAAPADLPKKFKYKPAVPNGDGISGALLGAGDGKAKILFKGKGAGLSLPLLPTAATELKVQLQRDSSAGCWESTFASPFAKNDEKALIAK